MAAIVMEEDGSASKHSLRERKKCANEKDNMEEITYVLTGEGFSDYREIVMIKVMNPCISA